MAIDATLPSLRNLDPEEQSALEPKTRKGKRSREALLEAARQEFREAGFTGARVLDMTARAGLSSGAFYRYFRDKDDILRSLLESFFGELYEFTRARWEPGDPQRSIVATTKRYLVQYREHADLYRVMIEAAQTERDIEQVWNDARQAFYRRIARNLRRAQDEGLIRPGVDPDLAASLLGGMTEQFAYLWFVLGREPDRDVDDVSRQVAELWCLGVFGQPAGEAVADGSVADGPAVRPSRSSTTRRAQS